MRTLLSIAVLATICSLSAQAQKNRCIIRDAGNLLEILNRDYASIDDPEVRLSSLQDDRVNVIGIFKAYTDSTFKPPTTVYQKEIGTYQWRIKRMKQQITALISAFSTTSATTSTTTNPSGARTIASSDLDGKKNQLSGWYDSLKKYQLDLESRLYIRDIDMLNTLASHFDTQKNALLNKMISQRFVDKFSKINTGSIDPYAASSDVPQLKKSLDLFSSGGFTVNNALSGLASFMAKRIKEELAAQIFEKVKRLLSDPTANDKFQEIKILLPTTVALLQTVSPEQYAGIINSVKESIEFDLNNLMTNLPKLANVGRVQLLIVKHPEIELAFLGVQLINELNHIKSPTEIIFVIENSSLLDKWGNDPRHKNFVNGIKLASLLVYSITEDAGDTRRFVSREEWVNLYKNADFYKLYLGFIIQQDKKYYNITFNNSTTLNAVMTNSVLKAKDWFDSFAPGVTNLVGQATEIEETLDTFKKMKANGRTISADSVANLLRSSVTFLDSVLSITDRSLSKLNSKTRIYAKSKIYISYARSTIDIYSDLGMKRYYSAVSRSVELVAKMASLPDLQKADQIPLIIDAVKKTERLFLNLDKEIPAGQISASTLNDLKNIAGDLKSVSSDNAYSIDQALTGNITNPATIGQIKALLTAMSRPAAMSDFVKAYEKLFLDNLSTAGIDNYGPLFSLGSAPASLPLLRDALAKEVIRLSSKVDQNADMVKLINFLVAIAKAQNSEDFEQAIEAIALPTGSSTIKRQSAFNISLNGYAGFFGGVERVYEANSNAGAVAFTTPIGVAFSKSFGKPCEGASALCKSHSSWTLFLSAIDIGALTSVRFKNNDQPLPELTFSNVFAPGMQLIWGIPGSSFSIAGGAQLGPFLRKINVDTPTNVSTTQVSTTVDPNNPNTTITTTTTSSQSTPVLDTKAALRFGISVLIDIPIINFYTKSKGYRK